jgi:crotonobetainyl-CoA:carnitine CoA-transferase CaiB-like acyl-CoA transferase
LTTDATTATDRIIPPLQGIRAVEVNPTLSTSMATQFLADSGAEVVMVEPPGGCGLRQEAGWPVLARGKQSIELDLHDDADRQRLLDLLETADILVEAGRPQQSLTGMTGPGLRARYPYLIAASLTGWGSTGPWRDLKGYEGLVMAKTGMMFAARRMQNPPRPSFVAVPYASFGAAHALVHGILAALLERESSGLGQSLETDLVRGVLAIDTWNWFGELVSLRWPDAYIATDAWGEDGEPRSPVLYALLTAPTKDGHWLQFAQVSPALFGAMLAELGVAEMLAEPKWQGFPDLESADLCREFWGILISKVRQRTLAEWREVFAQRPDISAEIFRQGPEILQHPQLLHDRRTVTVETTDYGAVTQPSTLVHHNGQPLLALGAPPALNAHAAVDSSMTRRSPSSSAELATTTALTGVTIVEFGEMFASPYGSSLLADLGARVIKVESLDGDQIRNLLPFPELTGAKVMQGKESMQIDLHSEQGRAIAHRLVAHADIVVQSFRAGAAARLGIDEPTLRGIKPDLIYLNACGYGTDGPFAGSPAYAPSIGAAGGLALTNVPHALQSTDSMDEILAIAPRLNTAAGIPDIQGDALAAVGVASAMLLGLVARRRHGSACHFTTTMLASMTHVLPHWVADYTGCPPAPSVDSDTNGFGPLYRRYEASDGSIFLAAPSAADWRALTIALQPYADLGTDERFSTQKLRSANGEALQEALTCVFSKRTAAYWESLMCNLDVGCVAVSEESPSRQFQTDPRLLEQFATVATSPIFDEHHRLAPLVTFSRSATDAKGGCIAGQHTSAVMAEFGYTTAEIDKLRADGIIAGT